MDTRGSGFSEATVHPSLPGALLERKDDNQVVWYADEANWAASPAALSEQRPKEGKRQWQKLFRAP
jgi:hypothetical protein